MPSLLWNRVVVQEYDVPAARQREAIVAGGYEAAVLAPAVIPQSRNLRQRRSALIE
jgi:hypothetical protein